MSKKTIEALRFQNAVLLDLLDNLITVACPTSGSLKCMCERADSLVRYSEASLTVACPHCKKKVRTKR